MTFNYKNFKFDVATSSWKVLPKWHEMDCRLSFNLLPLVQNRFILVVSENDPIMFDTQMEQWIKLTQNYVYPDL